MLIMTVAMVRVSHAGMKMSGRFVPVLESPVAPLEKRAGPQLRAANPTIMTVMRTRRREEDFFAPAACGAP
jgi:hypothetical protein